MNWEDTIIDAAATDTGMRRSNNQDSHTVVRASEPETWRKRRGHLFMVADGMGAHAVGELASKLACDNIPHNYFKAKDGTAAEAMTKAYQQVGALIHGKAAANSDFQGMGTTCSTLLLLPEGVLIAHVGDSRVYRIRGGRIDQLSFDHSLVWELIRRNHLHPDHAMRTVPRNVITRSLGPDPQVEVDIEGPCPVEPGDVYLLCSDGLSGPVTDPELGAFAAQLPPGGACRYLIHLANLRGGPDNITVMVVRIGAWAEPGIEPEHRRRRGRRPQAGPGWGSRLGGLLGAPSTAAAPRPSRSTSTGRPIAPSPPPCSTPSPTRSAAPRPTPSTTPGPSTGPSWPTSAARPRRPARPATSAAPSAAWARRIVPAGRRRPPPQEGPGCRAVK